MPNDNDKSTSNAAVSLFDDISSLRLDQNFAATAGVKKVITVIPIDKPHKQNFVRVRPGEGWRLAAAILEIDEDREKYLVLPQLQAELLDEIKPVLLVTTVNRQGTLQLWPLRLPLPGKAADRWAESAMEGAQLAEKQWVRIVADQTAGMYSTFAATANLPGPEWPELPFNKILEIAFRGRIIDSAEHEIIKRLRGQA